MLQAAEGDVALSCCRWWDRLQKGVVLLSCCGCCDRLQKGDAMLSCSSSITGHTKLLVMASILRGQDDSFQPLWPLELEGAVEGGRKVRICTGITALSALP